MPATFCRWRIGPLGHRLPHGSQHAVGPVLDRVPCDDDLAQLWATAPVERAQPLGEHRSVVAVEAKLVGKQVVEDRIRREHAEARRSRLVDDLVGCAGAHVVDQHVAAREERRDLRTSDRHRRARRRRRSRARAARARACTPRTPRRSRASSTADAGERSRANDRLETLGRRVPAEHERAQAVVRPARLARTRTPRRRCRGRSHAASATEAGTSAGRRR